MVRPPIPAVNFVGSGTSKRREIVMSPIHIDDVASAFVAALENNECIGQTYSLGGPEVLTWKEMVSRVAKAAGRRKLFLNMPIGLMRVGASLFDWLPFFPVTRDQLSMLEEGNVADPAVVKKLIGREPAAFSVKNLDYLSA
jgi:NADH dehydrogenase